MGEKLISIKGLHKKFYDGEKSLHILKGITCDIYKGVTQVIVGSSGAGKSTLLHILGTLDLPTEGEVLYRGENLFTKSEEELAVFRNKKLGFVFQFHHLLTEFTALENVMFPSLIAGENKRQAELKARGLLARMGLEDRIHHKASELSGGEQQRVAVARALQLNPEIVLADEPTGNLDSKNSELVLELLFDLTRENGTGLVVVTHNESIVSIFDRCFVLKDGVLREN